MTPGGAATLEPGAGDLGADEGLYVYAVLRSTPDRLPDLVGLDDAPVELVTHGDLAAAVGRITLERPPGRRHDLMAHNRVLDGLAATGAVVPVQFGSVVLDGEALVEEILAPGAERFATLLTDLEGRVQLNLKATYHEQAVLAEIVASDPEVARLNERTREVPEESAYAEKVRLGELVAQAMSAKRDQDAAVLLEPVLPLVVAHADRPGGGVDHLLHVALLVEEARRSELEDVLEQLAEGVHERVRLQLVGPTPPYDFVADA